MCSCSVAHSSAVGWRHHLSLRLCSLCNERCWNCLLLIILSFRFLLWTCRQLFLFLLRQPFQFIVLFFLVKCAILKFPFVSVLLIYFVVFAPVCICMLPFLSLLHLVNHTSSHHDSFVDFIFTPFCTLFITSMQDLTLTNTRSTYINFHSTLCAVLITRPGIPHSLLSELILGNPRVFFFLLHPDVIERREWN